MRLIDADELVKYLKKYHSMSQGIISDVEHFPTAHMAIEALEKQATSEWIPCSERLPDNEQDVEITYTSTHWKTGELLYNTCRAFYTDGSMTTEDSSYAWNEIENWEYNENLDAYIIPEGWWETVSFGEEFSCVDQPVIAWMPLPEPYKDGEQND